MPVAKASQLRRKTVLVTVPGTDLQILCKRPDLFTLVTRGLFPQELLDLAVDMANEAKFTESNAGGGVPESDRLVQFADFIDRYVCAAALDPHVVLKAENAGDDAVWIDELDLSLKMKILAETEMATLEKRVEVPEHLKEFPEVQPAGVNSGSDVEALPLPAESVAGGQ